MSFSLRPDLPGSPTLTVVDVGAAAIDGPAPYQPLVGQEGVRIVGFEPDIHQLERLQALNIPDATFLGDAVGDGQPGILRICKSPGMTSLFEPDMDVLQHFHGFPRWAEVVDRIPMETRRLDDVPETEGVDYLKIDVQGGELGVLQGATERLKGALMIHLEVQFVPFYKDQPLFADLDAHLRGAGYFLHTFLPIHTRILKPLVIQGDPYGGLNQMLWTDAVYVRRFTDFADRTPRELLRLAWLAHDLYQSADLAALALHRVDEALGTRLQPEYLARLTGQRRAA